MPNSFTGIIWQTRISASLVGSEILMVQQAQEQKGEHKSICALFSKSAPWEITAVCCAPITASSSQGSAEKEMVIMDMMIAIIFTAQIYK